jgi:hypothetical protein
MRVFHKKIRITGNEVIVFSIGDYNYKLTSYGRSNLGWNHKRLSKVSSWRWIQKNSVSIVSVKSRSLSSEYVKEVEDDTIFKILYHFRIYLEKCGIRNFAAIKDVLL